MKATDILMQEHRAIERALDLLDMAERRLSAGKPVRAGFLDATISFLREFADRCHHGKEEGLLFPAMERSGFPRETGPLAVMLHEHDEGREFVGAMNESIPGIGAGSADAAQRFCAAARGFTSLLRSHIMKEDRILFLMADARLPLPEKERLEAGFAEAEATGAACRSKAVLLRTLESLEAEALVAEAAITAALGPTHSV